MIMGCLNDFIEIKKIKRLKKKLTGNNKKHC